jgi:hypothetical protein
MKPQRTVLKGLAITIALVIFLAFAFALPSASAQDAEPLTPSPLEPSLTPEATLQMEATPEPPSTLEIPQEDGVQSLRQVQSSALTSLMAEEWSTQANISYTTAGCFLYNKSSPPG